jgi:ligand-binding sensor domain-containing protein
MSGNVIAFSDADMRAVLPAYNNPVAYPTTTLNMWFNNALGFMTDEESGLVDASDQGMMIYLMAGHLMSLSAMICDNDGAPVGLVSAATVDKVSVTMQLPPNPSQFQWWLSTTPYGAQLYAMLGVATVGGYWIGGSPQRWAYRGLRRGIR